MFIKIAGAAAVGAASAALGFYYSNLENYRIQDLLEFKKALLILSSEIEYIRTALPEASRHIECKTNKPVSGIFARFAFSLEQNDRETTFHAWEQALASQKKHAYLAEEDWENLSGFGKTLGYLDKQMQLNAINLTVDYIDAKVALLQTNCEKNRRMYRNLGLLGGLLIAVVLW